MKKILSLLFVFSMVVLIAGTFGSTVNAVADFSYCHNSNNWHVVTSNENGYHPENGDFIYAGPVDGNGNPTDAGDAWCANNAPVTTSILTLTKVVDNGEGKNQGTAQPTDWTLSASGPTNISGKTLDASITSAIVNPGSYTLGESGGPADASDYTTTGIWNCSPNQATNGNSVTLAAGDNVTCTIINTFSPQGTPQETATLTLVKHLDNRGGGTAKNTDWTLKATGPTTISGALGDASITNASVSTGQYTFSESGGPANASDYTAGSWSCTDNGNSVSATPLVLASGDVASCSILNTYTPNNNGGTPQEETCIAPNTVQSGDKLTTINTTGDGALFDLQAVLNANYSGLNKITSETGIQSWTIPAGTDTVTFDAKLLSASAGNTNEFGYYFDGDTSTFVSLITVPGGTNPAFDSGPIVVTTTGHTSIGFAIKSTGKTGTSVYASQYGLNTNSEDHVAVYTPSSDTYAMAFEDAPFASSDKDYNDLIAELKVVSCTTGGNQCVPQDGASVVSDNTTANTTDGGNAVALSFINPAWTASIPGATWIWATDPVVGPTNSGTDLTKVFTKTFNITGTPTSGTLDIAVDNNYSVKVNGTSLPVVFDQNNFQLATQDSYDISSLLVTGTNTLEITATNLQDVNESPDPAANPAGVLFKVTWSSDCNTPPPTDVCTNLPGNQSELPAGDYFASAGICMPIVNGCTNDVANNFNPEATPGNPDANQCTFNNGGSDNADLSVTKTVDNATPDVGQQIIYTIKVSNAGPNTATSVAVSDLLPAGVTYVSDDSSGAYVSGTGVWTVGTLASGADATLHITVSVNSGTSGDTITNTASISHSDIADSNSKNNFGSQSVTVNASQDSNPVLGCTNPTANNFNSKATPGNADANKCTFDGGNGGGGGGGGGGGRIGGFVLGASTGPGQVLGAETSCGIYVDKFLRKGLKNNDKDAVKKVQQFLNNYFKAGIAVDGIFGNQTESSLEAFQLAHKDKVLAPWNLTGPTGIFYLTTQTEVNNIMCPTLNLPIPSPLIPFNLHPLTPKV